MLTFHLTFQLSHASFQGVTQHKITVINIQATRLCILTVHRTHTEISIMTTLTTVKQMLRLLMDQAMQHTLWLSGIIPIYSFLLSYTFVTFENFQNKFLQPKKCCTYMYTFVVVFTYLKYLDIIIIWWTFPTSASLTHLNRY